MLHSSGHINCPACALARDAVINPQALARMPFPEAAGIWLELHSRQVSPRTAKDYADWAALLEKFFGSLELHQIHIGHLEQYQKSRTAGTEGLAAAGPVCINHELGVLCQILKRAGLWAGLEPYYKPLRIPKSKRGMAMTPEQEDRLFTLAASNPRWKLAFWCSLITANTTAGPGELKALRMRDVQLGGDPPNIHIREGLKNEHRDRYLPLNESALWAVRNLYNRAKELGCTDPDHYLLPHRAHKRGEAADPTRPMGSWRKAWEALREAAGMPSLRLYDLRHHVITKLLEDENVSERTVIELAGHVSKDMLNRYSHIRMKTKLSALNGLQRKAPEAARANLMLIKK